MRYLPVVLLIFLANGIHAQSFEGTLTYTMDFTVAEQMAKMGMTKEILLDKMKQEGSWSDTVLITYRQGNYYTLMNGDPRSWSVYTSETNKIHTFQEGEASDICTVTDASIDLEFQMTGKKPTIQKLDTTVVIDGIPCSVVRVKWNMGFHDYIYNPKDLKVDPTLFKGHIFKTKPLQQREHDNKGRVFGMDKKCLDFSTSSS